MEQYSIRFLYFILRFYQIIKKKYSEMDSSVPCFTEGGYSCAKPLRVCSNSSLNNALGIHPIAFVSAEKQAR